MTQLIKDIYPVEFKVAEPDAAGFLTWTDIQIHEESLLIKSKTRTVSIPNQFQKRSPLLRSVLIGQMQRLAEIPNPMRFKIHCLIQYASDLKKVGFTNKEFKNAVFGASRVYPKSLMLCLKTIARRYKHL